MDDEQKKKNAYLKALENLSGLSESMPQAGSEVAGRIFTPGQGWKPGPRATLRDEMAPPLANNEETDPYELLKKQQQRDEIAGRIFTPGQGWKTLPRG